MEGVARSVVSIWEAGCGQAGEEAVELDSAQIMLGLVIQAREGSRGPRDSMGIPTEARREGNQVRQGGCSNCQSER